MAIIKKDLKIADKPTLDAVHELLLNPDSGLAAIGGKTELGLSNMILKTLPVYDETVGAENTEENKYRIKSNPNFIIREFEIRPSNGDNCVYGIEPIGDKNGDDKYMLCMLSYTPVWSHPKIDDSNTGVGIGICGIFDIILSDDVCIRRFYSAYNESNKYANMYGYSRLTVLNPIKYGLEEIGLNNIYRELFYTIKRYLYTDDSTMANGYLGNNSQYSESILQALDCYWVIANPSVDNIPKGQNSLYQFYTQNQQTDDRYPKIEKLISDNVSSKTMINIMNTPIISNYFDIKLETRLDLSFNGDRVDPRYQMRIHNPLFGKKSVAVFMKV